MSEHRFLFVSNSYDLHFKTGQIKHHNYQRNFLETLDIFDWKFVKNFPI